MPQIKVTAPDGSVHTFPEGTPMEVVQAHMRKLYPPAAKPSMLTDPLIPGEKWANQLIGENKEGPTRIGSLPIPAGLAQGVIQGAGRTVEQMSSPAAIGSGVGAGYLMSRAGMAPMILKSIFSGLMGYQGAKEIGRAVQEPTTRGKAAGTTSGILQALMAALPWKGEARAVAQNAKSEGGWFPYIQRALKGSFGPEEAKPMAMPTPASATPPVAPEAALPLGPQQIPLAPVQGVGLPPPKPAPQPSLDMTTRIQPMEWAHKQLPPVPTGEFGLPVTTASWQDLFPDEAMRAQLPKPAGPELPLAKGSLPEETVPIESLVPPVSKQSKVFDLKRQIAEIEALPKQKILEGENWVLPGDEVRPGLLKLAKQFGGIRDPKGIERGEWKAQGIPEWILRQIFRKDAPQDVHGLMQEIMHKGFEFPSVDAFRESFLHSQQRNQAIRLTRKQAEFLDAQRELRDLRQRLQEIESEPDFLNEDFLDEKGLFDYQKAGAREPGEEGFARMKDQKPEDNPLFDFMASAVQTRDANRKEVLNGIIDNILHARDASISKRDLLGLNKKKSGSTAATPLFDEKTKSLFDKK